MVGSMVAKALDPPAAFVTPARPGSLVPMRRVKRRKGRVIGDRQWDEPGRPVPMSLDRLQGGVLTEPEIRMEVDGREYVWVEDPEPDLEKADRTAAAIQFRDRVIAAEAEFAAILHRWLKRRVHAAASKVKSEKSRRHTRHWDPPGDRELKADPALGDEARWRSELEVDAEGFLHQLTVRFGNSAGEAVAAAVGVTLGPGNPAFDAAHKRVSDALRRRAVRIGDWSDEVAGTIRDTIAEGEQAGLSISAISQTLLDYVDESGMASAERVARTEVTGAANAAALEAADQSGVVTKKQWLATPDERTRPSHAEADGQVVAVDDLFDVGDSQLDHPGDERGPAEETINCRCAMLLLVETDDGSIAEVDPGDSGDDTEKADRKDFSEDDHPRDDHGQFTSGGGSDSPPAGGAPSPAAAAFDKLAGVAASPYASNPDPQVARDALEAEIAVRHEMDATRAAIFETGGAAPPTAAELKGEAQSAVSARMASSTDDMLRAVPSQTADALAVAMQDPTVLIGMNAQGSLYIQQSDEGPHDPAWGDVRSDMASLEKYATARGDQYAKGGSPEAETLARDYAASCLIHNWAASSNDTSATSLAIQQAAEAEFGLKGTASWADNPPELADRYAQSGPVYRDFLRAQYEETQSRLAGMGITDVTVQRGFKFGGPDAPPAPAWAAGLNHGYWQHTGAIPMRPLSSWSTDPKTAQFFAKGAPQGVVITANIPATQILSYPGTGVGCLEEAELVCLGGPVSAIGYSKVSTR